MARLIDVVRCADCIHHEDGECEFWEYDVVKPYGFCWWGQTASGREPTELEAIPVSFLEKLRDTAQNDNAAFAIEEAIVQWRMKESLKDSDRKILYGEMKDNGEKD